MTAQKATKMMSFAGARRKFGTTWEYFLDFIFKIALICALLLGKFKNFYWLEIMLLGFREGTCNK